MPDIKSIADKADLIINGYAFTRKDDCIHVRWDAGDFKDVEVVQL